MSGTTRYFKFNVIHVIESLFPDDKKTGKELYDDIVNRIPLKIPILRTEFHSINSRVELLALFNELDECVSNGDTPYLHFEIHGSRRGFVLNSEEELSWTEIAGELRKINKKTRNNVMVSLATCFGAYIFESILPSQPSPFYGFIAPPKEVTENQILVSFTQFFEYIMQASDAQNIDLEGAVTKLNEYNDNTKFALCVSEAVFNRVMLEHEMAIQQPGVLNRRVGRIFENALKNKTIRSRFSRTEIKRQIARCYIVREPTRLELKKIFLMQK